MATTVLIGQGDTRPGEEMLQGFAIRPGLQNIDNQRMILSSYNIIRKTVDDLHFEIDVYKKGFRSQVSFYPMSPLKFESGPDDFPYGIEFIFENVDDKKYNLSTSSKSRLVLDTILSFGQLVRLQQGSFILSPQAEFENLVKSGERIYFRFFTIDELTEAYMNRLNVQMVTPEGGIVRLSLQGSNRIKDVMFLNKLTEVFINDNLEKKNIEANRIIEFIDAQLVDVLDSLALTENQLQNFRSANRIMDISVQAGQIVDQALQLENETARLTLERNYYNYLDEYLSKGESEAILVVPSSVAITDPVLSGLIQELTRLQTEYYSSGVGERNPLQGQLDIRIRKTKQSIKETLDGLKLASQMALDENSNQIRRLNQEASKLPRKEQQLLGFERKFNLNNVLYTYLLQQRAEAQIQRASNKSDHELVDTARLRGYISPYPRNVYLFAIVLALGIPTIIIVLWDLFDNKINSEEDLNQIGHPIIAHLPNSRLKYNTVVLTEPNSRISEAFRSLRTKMEFFTGDVKCPLIIVTSSIPGEGKTFTAINLASAYSLTGKRTLLIGFDLRRPVLSKSFDLGGEEGMTNFLIGKSNLKDITYKTDFPNLFVIPSGIVPPNPGELASSDKVLTLFPKLKEEYDYIIVDSPPIGVISDIYPVAAISDLVLMVVRHNFSEKNILNATLTEIRSSRIKRIGVVVNDIRTRGSSYSYSYKYKYENKRNPEQNKSKGLK